MNQRAKFTDALPRPDDTEVVPPFRRYRRTQTPSEWLVKISIWRRVWNSGSTHGVKCIVFCLGMLATVWARADAEAGWIVGTWVVDVEKTVASMKPSSSVPNDSIEKYKIYLSTHLLTVAADTLHLTCPTDDIRPEIDIEYQYVVTGAVKQLVVLRGQVSENKVERIVFDFASRDRCSFSLKFFKWRMYWMREGTE